MKDRLRKVRKLSPYGKNQESFAIYLGIPQTNLASYETGRRTPSDAVIELICEKCNINKTWLRTGEGEMTVKRTRNQEIADFMNGVMELPDQNMKKRLIEGLARLDENDWENILEIAEKLFKEIGRAHV